MKKLCPDLAFLFLALGFLAGCAASPYRAYPQYEGSSRETPPNVWWAGYGQRSHPQYEERSRRIKTVALLPPDAKVYQLTAGERRDLVEEWSEVARNNLAESMAKQVGAKGSVVLKAFDPSRSPDLQQEYEDVRPLFEAVALSALAHAYQRLSPQYQLETKEERFDYSLGPLTSLGEAAKADTLLFVYATDHISTGGRVLRNMAFFIPTYGRSYEGGQTIITAALVDPRTGDLLWFDARGSTAGHGISIVGHDLRDPASAESLVRDVLGDLTNAVPDARN